MSLKERLFINVFSTWGSFFISLACALLSLFQLLLIRSWVLWAFLWALPYCFFYHWWRFLWSIFKNFVCTVKDFLLFKVTEGLVLNYSRVSWLSKLNRILLVFSEYISLTLMRWKLVFFNGYTNVFVDFLYYIELRVSFIKIFNHSFFNRSMVIFIQLS